MLSSSLEMTTSMAREQVMGDDDLFIEILIRLPAKSIFKSRFVSKRWNSVISSTYFLDMHKFRRQEQLPLLAFMLTSPRYWLVEIVDDKEIPTCWSSYENVRSIYGNEMGIFMSSSNGLVLFKDQFTYNYTVVNFWDKGCVELPTLPIDPRIFEEFDENYISMALVYDEVEAQQAMAPCYKVVMAPTDIYRDVLPIMIYSSHTGYWTMSSLKSAQGIFSLKCYNKPPVVLNGFLYWYSDPWGLAIMDTKHMVNRVKIETQLIPLPNVSTMEPYFNFGFTRSSSGDELWFGAINDGAMKFWRLPMEKHSNIRRREVHVEEWVLVDSVSVNSLAASLLRTILSSLPSEIQFDLGNTIEGVLFKMEALIPWNGDIIVLLRIPRGSYDVTFLYNLQSKSIDLIDHHGWEIGEMPNGLDCCGLSPIMESLTVSSYGPLKQQPTNSHKSSIWRFVTCEECSSCIFLSIFQVISATFLSIPGFRALFKYYFQLFLELLFQSSVDY